jgi:hypothetical protein
MAAKSPAFPDRPLTVLPPGHGLLGILIWLPVALLVLAGCVMIVTTPIPDLLQDWAIRDTARQMPQARVEDGRCKTRLVLVDCEAILVLPQGRGQPIRQPSNLYFVDLHFGGYTTSVMGDPARSPHLTTNLALEKFWNRVITLALSIPFFGAIAWYMVASLFKQLRERRHILGALDRRVLRPVALKLGSRGQKTWHVSNLDPNGVPIWREWKVSSRIHPITLDSRQELILGVTAGDGIVAMPLDSNLTWIGLSEPERAALRQSLLPQ